MKKRLIVIFTLALFALCSAFYTEAYAQTRLTGTVTDIAGQPLPGATVLVKGTTNTGTATDMDGNFALTVPSDATLTVSYIGFLPKDVVVGNQTNITIQLQEDAVALEDVVVIGYGVQRKSDVTGAIAQVKSSDLENRTATDIAQAMQGKAAGVQIVNTSGAPGSSSSIQIRGYSSNSKTSPLIIVDGLKVRNFNYLDPENIESMEVLKDAASAAIYGIEAGNGVILITTKSGSSSKTKGDGRIFYNFQQTFQEVAKDPDLMNAKEYMEYQILSGACNQDSFSTYDGVTDTYWPDYMFERGKMQRHTVGFQGGNERGNLYVSLTSMDNNGIITGDKDIYKRLTGQVNADYKIKSWAQIGITTSFEKSASRTVTENVSANTTVMGSILTYDPTVPYVYNDNNMPDYVRNWVNQGMPIPTDKDGNVYGISPFSGNSLIWHPAVMRDRTDSDNKGFNVRGTAYLNLTPIKGFTFTSRLGYRAGYSTSSAYNYEMFVNSTASQNFSITGRSTTNLYYQWENFANYAFNLGKNAFTAMAGMSFENTNSDFVNGSANQLSNYSPSFRYLSNSVNTSNMSLSGIPSESASLSYFGRVGWSYDNRYNVQASFRADAYDTSKLDKDHRWGYFPSVSVGWNISNEKFMKDITDGGILTSLKLRGSWGVNGNVNALGSYQYATTLSSSVRYGYDFTDTMIIGVSPSSVLPNPEIKWETSRQVDVGLDARFFNDRLSMGIDWYNKNTVDLLTSTTAPGNTGASTVYVNAGKVNNKGLEVELGWKDNIGDFSYSVNGNIATIKNLVVEGTSKDRVPGSAVWGASDVTYFEEGYPLWYLRTYVVDHIDQQTGAVVYKDFDGNGIINAEDREMTGSGIPDFTYGLTINLNYKGFDLTVYGAGVQGVEKLFALNRNDFAQTNLLREFYTNCWKSPSSTGYKYAKPDFTDTYCKVSDARVYDASFFKIKQIQLGYNVPGKLLKKIKLSQLRVYASMDDWFTFTKYPGLDPETSAMHGASSGAGMAIDFGSYPISKKVVFGVNVSF